MSDPAATSIRETVLRQCLAADPHPWYPRDYALTAGIDRENLYGPLNDLRVANLVQLTDWVPGKGQGYMLTMLGREVLSDPAALAQLRDGAPAVPSATGSSRSPEDRPTTFDIGEAARQAFFAPGRVRVVPLLLLTNIVAFAISLAVAARSGIDPWEFLGKGSALALDRAGALSATGIAAGEWWRLVTNCFLHYGLIHLLMNMTTLFLARRVEVLWGSGRFLALYLISGICGSCVAVFWSPGEGGKITVLAGASGALWGVMMSEIVWLVLNRSHFQPGEVRLWTQQLVFTLLLNVGVSMLPNVSAAAHFGGAAAGVLSAFLLRVHQLGPTPRRSMAAAVLLFLPLVFVLSLSAAMESDRRLQPFVVREYQDQATDRLGRLPAALDDLEPRAERLFLQPSSGRDPAEMAKVRDGLQGLVKDARTAADWLKKSNPAEPAKPMRERGLTLVKDMTAYAEALDRQAGGEVVGNLNELRTNWQNARAAWEKAAAR